MIAKRVCPLFESHPKAWDESENCGSCLHYKMVNTVTDACKIKPTLIQWMEENETND
ncbi:hypothetical protein [Paenibacillus sp. Soil724D2]|uniref:hypothetical protein n=1 Tax=Paenibacillus sp. (strain Soil724D2) TaxID=1736392 RepID=UPI000ACFFCDC|nr:hypothetical protein [Paenibacillus sp. Soil724D2]